MHTMLSLGVTLALVLNASSLGAAAEGTVEGVVRVRGMRDSRDVVVYVEKAPGMRIDRPTALITMDQRNLTFVPHVLPVLVGTRVAFPNSDEIRHNVFSPRASPKLDLGTYEQGVTKYYTFENSGVFTLLCNTHAEMSAYVVAVDTPWFAVTGADGTFTIRGLPAGTYMLKTWHERAKPSTQQVTVVEGTAATVRLELR